jgi:hypothetical protein
MRFNPRLESKQPEKRDGITRAVSNDSLISTPPIDYAANQTVTMHLSRIVATFATSAFCALSARQAGSVEGPVTRRRFMFRPGA